MHSAPDLRAVEPLPALQPSAHTLRLERRRVARAILPRHSGHAAEEQYGAARTFPMLDGSAALLSLVLIATWLALPGASVWEVSWMEVGIPVGRLIRVAIFLGAWRTLFALFDLYTEFAPDQGRLPRLVLATALGSLLVPLVLHGVGARPPHEVIVIYWLLATALTLTLRLTVDRLRASARPAVRRRVLIVGTGPRGTRLYHQLVHRSDVEIVGCADVAGSEPSSELRAHWLGAVHEVEQILVEHVVDEVLIALPIKSCYADIQSVISVCERMGVSSKYLADLFECSVAQTRFGGAGSPWMSMQVVSDDYRLSFKRLLDLVGAIVGLALLAPLLVLIAAAIKLTSPGPVLFVQERYGFNKRRFGMLKFRTMVDGAHQMQPLLEDQNEAEGPVFKIRDDPRVTAVGRVLRRLSLDELPQLVNVLRGEMSLVGPRPLPIRDVSRFNEAWLMRRFSVMPGVTCLWQIGGRSELGFDDWVALDLQYIDHWSLTLDFWILIKTLPAVLRGTGAT